MPALPQGFEYFSEAVTVAEEQGLLASAAALPFSAVVMRGYTAKRRTAHFGVVYGYDSRSGEAGPPLPEWLHAIRDRVARLAKVSAHEFTEALVTEYQPGAVIGWHRDAPMFGPMVLGLSLGSSCRMRFRRRTGGGEIERASIVLEPRSAYVLRDAARREWQHSIPAVDSLRYSITFRSVRVIAPASRSRRAGPSGPGRVRT